MDSDINRQKAHLEGKSPQTSYSWRPARVTNVELLYGCYRHFSFSRHFHSVAAIGVVENGVMQSYWQGTEYQVPEKSVILFNAGEVHAPFSVGKQGWSFRMFYLDASMLSHLFDRGQEFTSPFVKDQALAEILLKAHRSFQVEDVSIRSESVLISSIPYLQPYIANRKKPELLTSGIKIRQAQEYLRANCTQNVTLAGLSHAVGLSQYHLIRSFHKEVGIPPHTYLMQARVEKGQSLLRSGFSIADTAFKTGFVDQSHFSRHFKRFTGVTPGQYSC